MGLAGRRIKQRIGADPRNLSWADDASKFGSAYLAKFGWESSKGLGASGDGRTTHVKVQQKLDMLGIGAAHMRDPNGIAWKQNKDFENLLKRLNEQIDEEGGGDNNEEKIQKKEDEGTKVEGFVLSGVPKAKGDDGATEVTADEELEAQKTNKKKKKKKDRESKKAKKEKDEEQEEGKKRKRKRKDEKDKESKTKKQKTSDIGESPEGSSEKRESKESTPRASETPAPTTITQPVIPRLRAHRARAIAAKNMLSSSATAMSEILGIAPTPSGSATPQAREQLMTPLDNDTVSERITTSAMSVADYFKEKLLSRPAAGQSSGSTTPSRSASGNDADADIHDAPRGGLGLSRCRMDINPGMAGHFAEDDANGMNKFSSLMVSKFLAATSTAVIPSAPEGTPDRRGAAEGRGEPVEDADNSRRRKKDKKKKKDRDQTTIDQETEGHDYPREKSKKEKKRRKGKDECSVAAL